MSQHSELKEKVTAAARLDAHDDHLQHLSQSVVDSEGRVEDDLQAAEDELEANSLMDEAQALEKEAQQYKRWMSHATKIIGAVAIDTLNTPAGGVALIPDAMDELMELVNDHSAVQDTLEKAKKVQKKALIEKLDAAKRQLDKLRSSVSDLKADAEQELKLRKQQWGQLEHDYDKAQQKDSFTFDAVDKVMALAKESATAARNAQKVASQAYAAMLDIDQFMRENSMAVADAASARKILARREAEMLKVTQASSATAERVDAMRGALEHTRNAAHATMAE